MIDHARFGRDFCVIGTWKGMRCVRVDVLTKSDTNDIMRIVILLRKLYMPIPAGNIIIDQDGIGVKDMLQCESFNGNETPPKIRMENTWVEPNYKNLKTMCYYLAAESVNAGLMAIDKNFYIEGIQAPSVKLRGQTLQIQELIKADLMAIKRDRVDSGGKYEINSKAIKRLYSMAEVPISGT